MRGPDAECPETFPGQRACAGGPAISTSELVLSQPACEGCRRQCIHGVQGPRPPTRLCHAMVHVQVWPQQAAGGGGLGPGKTGTGTAANAWWQWGCRVTLMPRRSRDSS